MIDIHHHLLFGIDDGPKDIESSIAQAEAAVADGITHIACTPHANEVFDFNPLENEERLNAIRERVGKDLTLVTVPGASHFVQQDASDLVSRMMRRVNPRMKQVRRVWIR